MPVVRERGKALKPVASAARRRNRIRLPVRTGSLAACLLVSWSGASGPASAQQCDYPCPLASSYRTFSILVRPETNENDLLFSAGHLVVRSSAGGWMVRVDGIGGPTFYTSTPRTFGWMVGSQLGVARVWTGEYLEFGDAAVELFVTAGGGAYYAWRLAETPGERGIVPVVTAGAGLRFREPTPGAQLVMLELLREERIGVWGSRVYLRFGTGLALGGR